ncbi:glucosamine 6-phosphate N-acetyltransferase [Plasmodium brasilianum]|uniref:N-acetyltransferase, putative n=3 Tax=Plasmodium (Plasmodium) TaxID=418103 RepID=A0A1D3SMN1_PLAMA|nr:N-acetyltransferase, putative [Plasmodium malariae]KAI4837212.1 glucosamine 6-phosphate N-acetyltransferase [Plasmodium brasilianum]SCO93095.1 N-acetyltransferase, putative [Plasmodium malariae]
MELISKMKDSKERNKPVIDNYEIFKESYLDVLNKKKVLYKYVFLFNNYKFKFKIVSTYYEYLIICNSMLRDVTTCNLFFGPLIFFEMLGKSFYYPYILYIYDNDNPYTFQSIDFNKMKFEKSSIMDIDNIIRKGKEKNKRYMKKSIKNFNDSQKIILNENDLCTQLKNYNLENKNIVGYTEIYLLFHMARCFDSRIERLVVHKEYRNKSFGMLIMYICIYVLKYLYQCNRCDLNVENDIALKIYKKLKFLNVQTQVYRLHLHCNYNFLPKNASIENDRENIQIFMENIIQ